jgi:hypothetical protein
MPATALGEISANGADTRSPEDGFGIWFSAQMPTNEKAVRSASGLRNRPDRKIITEG